jgi:hypothetical protein
VQPLSEVFFEKVLACNSLKNGAERALGQAAGPSVSQKVSKTPPGTRLAKR